MLPFKLGRVWPIALCFLTVKVAGGCSDTGSPADSTTGGSGTQNPGASGSSPGTAGTGVSGAPATGGGPGSGGSTNGGTPGAGGAPGTGGTAGAAGAQGGSGVGGATGGSAGSGGSAGAGGAAGGTGGSGGGSGMAFTPCSTAPAATVPMLKRGAAINGFTGMQTAGQIVGVPGEPGILYVIGHRDGNVFTVQDGQVVATPLVKVDVANGGNNEQGLLSMALHPSFATNHLFYLFYTAAGGGDMTIDEFERMTPTTAVKKQNIYSKPRAAPNGVFHNGGQISFNPKDATPQLYFSVGNNESDDAGNPTGDSGRVLKIDVASKAAITYAYGLRNPYRTSIDRLTGDMYIADVANGSGGTIIFNPANAAAGKDFLYRRNNGDPDVNDGVLRDTNGAAIIGGFVYRGSKIPGLCGRYFYGNFQGGAVKSIVVQNGQRMGDPVTHTGLTVPGNLTSFGEDGEGELYMASLNNNAIYKIEAQ